LEKGGSARRGETCGNCGLWHIVWHNFAASVVSIEEYVLVATADVAV
jgi:hypothetical protein